jgi:hypothetical protein
VYTNYTHTLSQVNRALAELEQAEREVQNGIAQHNRLRVSKAVNRTQEDQQVGVVYWCAVVYVVGEFVVSAVCGGLKRLTGRKGVDRWV